MSAKRTTRKTSKNTSKKNVKQEEKAFFGQELAIILSFLVCVLLFLSNLKICGAVGDWIRKYQLGFFGVTGYVFPVILFISVVFVAGNRDNPKAWFKILAAFFSMASVATIIALFMNQSMEKIQLDPYRPCGILGGAIATLLEPFGTVGTFLIMLAVLIISIVFITEKSFVNAVKRGSGKVYEHARVDADRAREERALRREDRNLRRQERILTQQEQIEERRRLLEQKVEGINFDATNLSDTGKMPSPNPGAASSAFSASSAPAAESAPETKVTMKEEDHFATPEDQKQKRNPDVFTGKILNPMSSADDSVPFDADDVTEAIEKANVILDRETAGNAEALSDHYAQFMDSAANRESGSVYSYADTPAAEEEFRREAGTRTIVTASGKVIQSDVDVIHKKMEDARKHTEVGQVKEQISKKPKRAKPYKIPPLHLLTKGEKKVFSDKEYKETAIKLQQTLQTFGISVTVTNISCGPAVTRYEMTPEIGVKVSRILNLQDDLKLALAAADIRIEAPIPGKAAIGIEVPNSENSMVYLRDLLESKEYKNSTGKIAFALGKDLTGSPVVTDVAKMPHLLIAGATGSGKSVCINTLIMSLLYKYSPEDLKLLMVDPKVIELSIYNGIPHLLVPVVTDAKKASGALNWAVAEMEDRYRRFETVGAKDIESYNAKIQAARESLAVSEEVPLNEDGTPVELPEKMPRIVIIVDELADLMMVAKGDVETAIVRLTQLARAAGMHVVIATQRPSVNVITGLIKANIPSRIAFAVSSGVDSRTILDQLGAERLLGKGDMLFSPQGAPKPSRIQGAFVSEAEITSVVNYIKQEELGVSYTEETISKVSSGNVSDTPAADERDDLFVQAGRFIIDKKKASIGNLQRAFRIGFNRAARIMDQLEEAGVVGPEQGTKPRDILMSAAEFEELTRS